MLRKFFYLTTLIPLVSCSQSNNETNHQDFYRSKKDSVHAKNIENNLIPMYSVAGKVKRKTIPEMMAQDNIPGMGIAFVDDGEIAWTKHYGYADLKDSIPVNPKTVFTGASLSKPITAIAALNLVEKGFLDLDEDVNLKLKEWKVPKNEFTEKEKVTLRRLIDHTAGIKNDLWKSYLPKETVPTLHQLLSAEKPSVDPAVSVVFEPGSRTKYSNPGYSVIQKLLMDVTDEKFEKLIDRLIFEPVGMEDSSFAQPIPQNLKERKATGYTKDLEPFPYRLFPYQAAGGIWTTPTDLAKFMIALLDDHHKGTNKLISKEMSRTVFTKETMRCVFSLWNWGDDIAFQHSGSNQGFNCFMYGSIAKNQGIVVMTNSDNAFGLFDYIQRAVNDEYNWEYVKPEVLKPIEKDIRWGNPFLGGYRWRGNDLTLTKKDEDFILISDDEKYRLVQTGAREFVVSEIPLKITFSENVDEGIMTIWGPGGGPAKLKKISD